MPRQSSFDFSPAVLRTCRTVHQEGVPLLYNNTFACELWYESDEDDEPYMSSFLRPDWNTNWPYGLEGDESKRLYSTSFLIKHVKKLDIVVKVLGDEGCSSTRQLVRKFVHGIKKLVSLSHLKIRLDLPLLPVKTPYVDIPKWTYENREITRDDYKNQALAPFAFLRRLEHVEFDGPDITIAEELKGIMTGDTPAVDFAMMLKSLNQYTFSCVLYEHCLVCRFVLRYLERAEHAADMEDESAFKQARTKIFSLITEHQEQARVKACRFDVTTKITTDEGTAMNLLREQTYHSEDFDDHETNGGMEGEILWKPHMQLDWERRNEDTDEDRQRRKAEEHLRPSLIRLREIVRWERDESPWTGG